MANERDNTDERQARIDTMIRQFRAAQQRRLMKRGLTLWKRAAATELALSCSLRLPPDKIH